MKPTKFPDYNMDYGVDDYEEYDEDDFFYHMYFDEVSTTPIPSEFYDLLESVSSSDNSGFNYPDYFDYPLNNRFRNSSDSQETTQRSSRQSKNNRYLKFTDTSRRRNSKLMKLKRYKRDNKNVSIVPIVNKVKSRSKRYSNKNNRGKHRASKSGFRMRKQIGPGIIGILDRRIPLFFRQSPFVTIALTKFVILSTGVTTGENT